MILWISVILIVIFPGFLRDLAINFFITRLFDLIVVGGFLFLISITSWLYLRTKRLENKLERIIREDALKQIDNTKTKLKNRK
jgi:hypothetical protein